jgi:hypothetical protein
MKRYLSGLVALALLIGFGLSAPPAQAKFIVRFSQNGPNVVATGTGSFNLSALTFRIGEFAPGQVFPSLATVLLGPQTFFHTDQYSGISGPSSIGPGGDTLASSGQGPGAGVDGFGTLIFVPQGYQSGTSFTTSSTWNNTTISGLGLTPGTYVWTWGTGAAADSLVLIIPSPENAQGNDNGQGNHNP